MEYSFLTRSDEYRHASSIREVRKLRDTTKESRMTNP